MINWFKNLSKTVCIHDWEIVEYGDIYKVEYPGGKIFYYDKIDYSQTSFGSGVVGQNKVCIKCGECYNGIDIMKKEYQDYKNKKKRKTQEKDERKELAAKLWEDGCNGN